MQDLDISYLLVLCLADSSTCLTTQKFNQHYFHQNATTTGLSFFVTVYFAEAVKTENH